MPSPFPGMDPFLEDPALWPDVHNALLSVGRELLGSQIRPKYFPQLEDRLYVADSLDPASRLIVPDLHIRLADAPGFETHRGHAGASATALAEPGVDIEVDWSLDVRESFIEIRDLQEKRVVTIVEVLSPANKVPGSAGFESYHAKREQAIAAGVNVVEVDLLRSGQSGYANAMGEHDYSVVVTRFRGEGQRPKRTGWPIDLRRRLPNVPVPLRPEDGHAVLELQRVLDTAYDRAGYDLRVNYAEHPRPRLDALHDEWVHRTLKERALR